MSISEKLTTIAENQEKVYQAGQQSEYDRFWDAYQANGTRSSYRHSFAGTGWTSEIFKPKYDMCPTSAYMMFYDTSIRGDLDELLGQTGVKLDFSKSNDVSYLFYYSAITSIGTIDLSSVKNSSHIPSLFNSTSIKTIRNFIPPDLELASNCFQSGLTNLTIGGEISKSINLQRCTNLTYESLVSIFTSLKPFSELDSYGSPLGYYTEDAFTQTITLSSESKALLNAKDEETGGCSIEAMTWTDWLNLCGWNYL